MTGRGKLLIFAPNGGTSLSTGGGVSFLFRLAERVVSIYGHDVYIAGYHTLPESVLFLRNWDSVQRVQDKVHVLPGILSDQYFSAFSHFPFKLSAYDAMLSRNFSKWVTEVLEKVKPDFVLFNDDIPKAAEGYIKKIPTFLYVHFPLAARTAKIIPPMKVERPRTEAINEFLLLRMLDKLVVSNPEELSVNVLVNSSVTSNAIKKLGRGSNHHIFFPFWTTPMDLYTSKRYLTSIGTMHKEKRHDVLLKAVKGIKDELKGLKVIIAGYSREMTYVAKLMNYIRREQLQDTVSLEINVVPSRLLEILKGSLGIFQLGKFEPLGMIPLEGMRFGAVGVARKSEYSGTYTDILDHDKYGMSFENENSLSDVILSLMNKPLCESYRHLSIERVMTYSKEHFTEEMLNFLPLGRA